MSTADNDDATAADEPEVEVDADGGSEPEVEEADGGSEPEVEEADGETEPEAGDGGDPAVDMNLGGRAVGASAGAGQPVAAPPPDVAHQPHVSPIELAHLEPGDHAGTVGNLDLLRDIELSVTVEVGRARLRVRDLLALHEGSIVELDRPVGSPVDLLANGRAIARGEIVLVEDQLGIRVTAFNSDAEGD